MSRLAACFLAVMILGLCGCEDQWEWVLFNTERINGVVRVFMHRPEEYSVMISNETDLELKLYTYYIDDNFKIFEDAPANGEMWILIKRYKRRADHDGDNVWIRLAEIHIHSEKDVNGGEWMERRVKHTLTGETNLVK